MKTEKTIQIVEDESAIREMVRHALDRAGFNTLLAASAHEALSQLAKEKPDLILLDWMMPGMSGIDLARRLKKDEQYSAIPIIMLTARSDEDDRVHGLEIGADDYIVKPFSTRELVARINAVIRRIEPLAEGENIDIDGLQLNTASHRVSAKGEHLSLGPTEFRLLHFFMSHPERVYSRAQLLDHVWGDNVYIEDRTVDVHIRRLRKVLGESGFDKMIQTVRGSGYRFSKRS